MIKKNKLSAGSNLLWEGSRMMLPEHKEAIITQYNRTLTKTKPQLDQQKLDEIAMLIQESYYIQTAIQVTIFEVYEVKQYRGVVTYIDPRLKYIKLEHEEQTIKISCSVITDVSASSIYNS